MKYISLVGSKSLVFILTFATTALLTKILNAEEFGAFRELVFLASLLVIIFSFGINYNASFMLAKEVNNKQQDKIIASHLVIVSVIAIAAIPIISIISISRYQDSIPVFISFLFIYFITVVKLFSVMVSSFWVGTGQIYRLSLYTLIPHVIFLLLIFIFYSNLEQAYNNVVNVLMFFLASLSITVIMQMLTYIPRLCNVKKEFAYIFNQWKTYGFKVYQASVIGATAPFIVLIIASHKMDDNSFGLFALAFSFVAPLQMISSTLGLSKFRNFSSNDSLKDLAFQVVVMSAFVSVLIQVLYLLTPYLFIYIFDSAYKEASYYILVLSIYGGILGVGDLLNKYSAARGQSRLVRTASILGGVTSILGGFAILQVEVNLGFESVLIAGAIVYLLTFLIGIFSCAKNQ